MENPLQMIINDLESWWIFHSLLVLPTFTQSGTRHARLAGPEVAAAVENIDFSDLDLSIDLSIWVNYHISLTWIVGPFGDDFPY